MDIGKFFQSKKRELSDQSSNGDDPKKPRDGSLNDSENGEDVFTNSLKSPECVSILFGCLQNVEKQIKEIIEITNSTKESQIKGERQLQDLNESVNFISSKLDEYEKDRKEKDKIIKELQVNMLEMSQTIEQLEDKTDRQEQYSRRNCLLLHGIEENTEEDTDKVIIETLNEKMGEDLVPKDIDRSHRIGKPKKNSNKPRPIIIKFSRYNKRNEIFKNKKILKGQNISVTESLTVKRMSMLKKARQDHGFMNVWTIDGKILFKDPVDNKIKTYYD